MFLNQDDMVSETSTLELRRAFWNHLYLAAMSSDPESMYEDARVKLESMEIDSNDRLRVVRDVLLRILDSQQRKYHEIIDRNVTFNSASTNKGDSTTEDDLSGLDMTDEDLTQIDLSELDLTDEELALLLEG